MAVPKRKASKARTSRKHSINGKLVLPVLHMSSGSGDLIQRHRIDPSDGMYRNKKILLGENE